jgi:hypothetical protein
MMKTSMPLLILKKVRSFLSLSLSLPSTRSDPLPSLW